MLNSFYPERGSDLTHYLFGSIVGLKKVFLLLVELFAALVFCHNDLASPIGLAS